MSSHIEKRIVIAYNKNMQFANLHFDTYRTVNLLKERGYTKKQAEGFIEVMQEVTLSGVATKENLQEVKDELKKDIQLLEIRLTDKVTKGLSDTLKFQIIQTLTIIGVMVALAKIF